MQKVLKTRSVKSMKQHYLGSNQTTNPSLISSQTHEKAMQLDQQGTLYHGSLEDSSYTLSLLCPEPDPTVNQIGRCGPHEIICQNTFHINIHIYEYMISLLIHSLV